MHCSARMCILFSYMLTPIFMTDCCIDEQYGRLTNTLPDHCTSILAVKVMMCVYTAHSRPDVNLKVMVLAALLYHIQHLCCDSAILPDSRSGLCCLSGSSQFQSSIFLILFARSHACRLTWIYSFYYQLQDTLVLFFILSKPMYRHTFLLSDIKGSDCMEVKRAVKIQRRIRI